MQPHTANTKTLASKHMINNSNPSCPPLSLSAVFAVQHLIVLLWDTRCLHSRLVSQNIHSTAIMSNKSYMN